MRREYQITGRKGNAALHQFLEKEGAALLPMVELIEQGQVLVARWRKNCNGVAPHSALGYRPPARG